jgi:hypothetical protein
MCVESDSSNMNDNANVTQVVVTDGLDRNHVHLDRAVPTLTIGIHNAFHALEEETRPLPELGQLLVSKRQSKQPRELHLHHPNKPHHQGVQTVTCLQRIAGHQLDRWHSQRMDGPIPRTLLMFHTMASIWCMARTSEVHMAPWPMVCLPTGTIWAL